MLAVAVTVALKRGKGGVERAAWKLWQPGLGCHAQNDQRDARNREKLIL